MLYQSSNNVLTIFRSIADTDGPTIADMFYETLFEDAGSTTGSCRCDTTKAAQALHIAVKKLRCKNVSFVRWVPFIYLGR